MTQSNSHYSVIVGMSGGVDSSLAAYLLKEAGYKVSGLFMKNWEEDDKDQYCHAEKDMSDATSVCKLLDIPFHYMNFAQTYWERVFTFFLSEYRLGRTPNPDILCNKEIKFRAFLDYAKQLNADFIATGHYVNTRKINGHNQLLKGNDVNKDQSYFLHALSQEQLSSSLFPVGSLTKNEVRTLAKHLGFRNHDKKDSTGICFIGERKFKTFLKQYLPAKPGLIQTIEGKVIGEHEGLIFYTLGQRQGLKIGGHAGFKDAPWYVVHKDLENQTLIVAQGMNHPALYQLSLTISSIHWIHEVPHFPFETKAKTRYRQIDQACTIFEVAKECYQVIFTQLQRALTPGQSIVFYDDQICLGGGIIETIASQFS